MSEISGSVTGSNNLLLPIDARVKARLDELKTKGKDSFLKLENGEWMNIQAEAPIQGPLTFSGAVSQLERGVMEIHYRFYKTVKNPEGGAPKVETVLRKAGQGDPGTTEKVIEFDVIERFEPKKAFITKKVSLRQAEPVQQAEYSKVRDKRVKGDEEQS